MERASSSVMRLGPLARRLLARRRRWLRWAAIVLAALTILSAAAQLRHRPAPPRSTTPAGGQHPAPVPRYSGVSGLVPSGMRAVNLIVPASATFGGRLAPLSRVDVLAAFDAGQDRAVRRVVASGIVLHITLPAPPAGAGAPPLSPPEGRFGGAPVVELALAVPAAREREVVMAQAFGRVFVAVEPATADGSPAAAVHGPAPSPDAALSLRRYLGLPAAPPPATAVPTLIPTSAGLWPPPPSAWPVRTVPRAATNADFARASTRSPDGRRGGITVEVIEGTTRTVTEVRP